MTGQLVVPGRAYLECLDPRATGYAAEVGLPEPTLRSHGFGFQAVYDVSPETAREIVEHVLDFGEAISFGVDDPRVGQRLVRWASRWLEEHSQEVTSDGA